MSNKEVENVVKEIIVQVSELYVYSIVGKSTFMGVVVPQAIANYYSIKSRDGIICMLKEKSDNAKMKNAEKINKEILIDVLDSPRSWEVPHEIRELYDIREGEYLRLLIKEKIPKSI